MSITRKFKGGVWVELTNDKLPRSPTFGQKARNAASATGRVAKAAVKGEKILVSVEEKDRRMAICVACDHFISGTCDLCGCPSRWKTKLATESCPIQKW